MTTKEEKLLILERLSVHREMIRDVGALAIRVMEEQKEIIRLAQENIDLQKNMIRELTFQRDYYKENYEALKMQMEGR